MRTQNIMLSWRNKKTIKLIPSLLWIFVHTNVPCTHIHVQAMPIVKWSVSTVKLKFTVIRNAHNETK